MRNDKSKKTATAWLLATTLVVGLPQLASAETVLRIGMTAADIPRTLGQPDQGTAGATGGIQHHRTLLGDRALQRAVVERNSRHHRRAQVPFHFLARVVKTRVVVVQNQTDQTTFNSEQSLQLIERGAGMPQANQVRAGDQQDVLRTGQRNTVAGRGALGDP